MKVLDDHITIKLRMKGESSTRSYRVSEDDTVAAVFDRAWADSDTAGFRARYYLQAGDTILSSRRKLKDYDINEGDILDIVEDTE